MFPHILQRITSVSLAYRIWREVNGIANRKLTEPLENRGIVIRNEMLRDKLG